MFELKESVPVSAFLIPAAPSIALSAFMESPFKTTLHKVFFKLYKTSPANSPLNALPLRFFK